jgi:hypothetical protein
MNAGPVGLIQKFCVIEMAQGGSQTVSEARGAGLTGAATGVLGWIISTSAPWTVEEIEPFGRVAIMRAG